MQGIYKSITIIYEIMIIYKGGIAFEHFEIGTY